MNRKLFTHKETSQDMPIPDEIPGTSLVLYSERGRAADTPKPRSVDLKSDGLIDTRDVSFLRREEFLRQAHARPATADDYKTWLDQYVARGGKVTHPRNREFPSPIEGRDEYHIHNDWWVIQNPNTIPNVEKLYGAQSLNLIIPAGMHDFAHAFFSAKQFTLDNQDHPTIEAMREEENRVRDMDAESRPPEIPFLLDSREGWELGHTNIYMFEQFDADGILVAEPYTNNPWAVESFNDVRPNRRQQIGSRRSIGRSAASEHRRSLER